MTKFKIIQTGDKTLKLYDFKKSRLIAGICPDCKHIVMYREKFDLFECSNRDCFFIANKHGKVVFSNQIKSKAEKENNTQQILNQTIENQITI